jgi:hypothetical protein
MIKIAPGQLWSAGNRTEFYVDDVRIIEGETWVYYTNTFTQQTYSCLAPAFEQRFTIVLNRG